LVTYQLGQLVGPIFKDQAGQSTLHDHPEEQISRLYHDRSLKSWVWGCCRGILALLVAKMIKIEFLYGIAMDIHAKGAKLSDPLEIFLFASAVANSHLFLGGYEVPPWFGVFITL
jgi:hypothetical protein